MFDEIYLWLCRYTIPILFGVISAVFIYIYTALSRKKSTLVGKHVVVTGGSSGIGRSVAVEAARCGANVTIVARDEARLGAAKDVILRERNNPTQIIQTLSLDVCGDYDAIVKGLSCAQETAGPVFVLVNCAGSAICGRLEDTSISDIKRMMELNYLGSVYPTKAVIGGMKQRGSGHIVFTASQAALVGLYGYAAYSGAKFALRGIAESLHMEMSAFGIKVTLALPPDTDTPGFAVEEKSKPLETKLISQGGGLFSPDVVAKKLMDDTLDGRFLSTVGFEGFILTTLCAGMSPFSFLSELVTQVLLMSSLRLVSIFYLASFHRIIRKCMKTRNEAKKFE